MRSTEPLQLLTTAFDTIDVMIAVLDRNMNFIRVTRAYASRRGKPPSFFLDKNYFALYPDPEKEKRFRRAVQTGKTVRHWARPGGEDTEGKDPLDRFDWTLSPVTDTQGRTATLVLSIVDAADHARVIAASESKKTRLMHPDDAAGARQALPERSMLSYSKFTEAILDTVGSMVVVLDRHGRIVRFNNACEQVTGYRSEEVLGRKFWDFLLAPEEREPVRSAFHDLCLGIIPNTYENYWLTKEGHRHWIAWTNTALRDGRGNVDYIIAAGIDMTERRLAETALRQSEQQFRLLTENINEMFWLASPDRKIMYYVSPAFETIWGRPCTDIYANPMIFLATTPEEDRARILADHAEQAEGKFRDSYELEFRIFRPNGEMRWIASRYVPVLDENGNVFRVAGVSTDITKRKLAEEERIEHERMHRDALVREVHHRIKNSLQGIVGLLRQHSNRHPQLSVILQSAITQVTTMALVHGLQAKKRSEAILLCDMCEAIAANVMAIPDAAVAVQVTRRAPIPFVVAEHEAVPLALVMNELMCNMIKHSTRHGSALAQVDISEEARGVIVRLRNPGAHLPEGLDVMNGTGVGTGLGLVRTLLPKGSTVALRAKAGWIETEVRIPAPALQPLGASSSGGA